jgi:hypothetical protein
MDINNSLNVLVDSLSNQILEQVQSKVESSLHKAIQEKLKNIDVTNIVSVAATNAAKAAVDKYQPNYADIDQQLNTAAGVIVGNIEKTAKQNIAAQVSDHIKTLNFDNLATAAIKHHLDTKIAHLSFPANSIDSQAINFTNKISGNAIAGGIVEQFGSTGIDDKATDCKLTILDEHTVFENTLLAAGLNIKGPTVLEGKVTITGTIDEESTGFKNIVDASKRKLQAELGPGMFAQFSATVFDKIKTEGVDLNRLTVKGKEVINDNIIASTITDSNLQKLGVLRELQVKGESLFSNSVYITEKRLGINTLEPGAVLAVWDDEVEVQISKRKKDTAQIGTIRNQSVVLSSNNRENLVLNTDGSVTTQSLTIGRMNFSSALTAPNYEAPKGSVVFNENPSLGGPLGWVSLGAARWANFGIID